MRRFALLALALLPIASVEAAPREGPFQKIAVIRLREDSGDAIDPSVKTSVLRRIAEIEAWGADCVILDIESYGGLVTSSIEIGDELYDLGRRVHTVAYIHRKAISGAVMISLACQQIVMNEVASMGDSQAVYMTSEGLEAAPEKIQTNVATKFRQYAEGNGYPIEVCEAMVRAEMEVTRYRTRGGGYRYFRTDKRGSPPTKEQIESEGLTDGKVIVPEEQLATFSAKEAIDLELCSHLVPTLGDLVASLSGGATEVREFEWTWSEKTSRWLLGMRGLLFLVGAAALYFALKVPGTGVPEALAVICFGLFFGASAIAGFAGPAELILFVAGIALIVVEIFVLPGFGVAGVAGLACVLVSIGMAAIPSGESLPAAPEIYLLPVARDFLLGAFGGLAIVFLVARHLPSVPLFRRLHLEPPGPRGARPTATPPPAELVGTRGVAETRLRPAGRALLGGARHDVVAEGHYVDAGADVEVIAVNGPRIVVRPVEKA